MNEQIILVRINDYNDKRFSQKVLNQHGCYLVNDLPYEIEIINENSAIIHGKSMDNILFNQLIEDFRFYSPQIINYYNEENKLLKTYPNYKKIKILLKDIEPSQFIIDEDKVKAVSEYILKEEDIIIQVKKDNKYIEYESENKTNKYISLDGHTRLFIACQKGFKLIYGIESQSDDYIDGFVEEARKRKVFTPFDLVKVKHEEYEVKWNQFCDEYFDKHSN